MPETTINGITISVDDDGFMTDHSQWNRGIAVGLAATGRERPLHRLVQHAARQPLVHEPDLRRRRVHVHVHLVIRDREEQDRHRKALLG